MYIERTISGYDSSGQQVARRARFLILVQTDGEKQIRALVRKVALHQCGHFMMGSVRPSDLDLWTALVVRWRFFDSKDKAFREAQFHAETGEYLGECFIGPRAV